MRGWKRLFASEQSDFGCWQFSIRAESGLADARLLNFRLWAWVVISTSGSSPLIPEKLAIDPIQSKYLRSSGAVGGSLASGQITLLENEAEDLISASARRDAPEWFGGNRVGTAAAKPA